MAQFTNFSNVLPDPIFAWGDAGEEFSNTGTDGPGFAAVKLSSNTVNMTTNTNSLRRELADAAHHYWTIDIKYNPMTRDEFDTVFAFLRLKAVTMDPFYVLLPQYLGQTATTSALTGTPIRGLDVMEVIDLSTTVIPPTSGDIFNLDISTKIYAVTRVETETVYTGTQPPTDEMRFHITPSLQEDSSGGVLNFLNPMFYVRQVGDVRSYSLGKNNLYSYSLQLEEVRK